MCWWSGGWRFLDLVVTQMFSRRGRLGLPDGVLSRRQPTLPRSTCQVAPNTQSKSVADPNDGPSIHFPTQSAETQVTDRTRWFTVKGTGK